MSLLFDDMAFVGLYFVLPQYRGRQIGTRLFSSVMTQSVSNANVGLHAGANNTFKVENAHETPFSESFGYERSISKSSREKFFQITSVCRDDAICKVE
ncbi:hypothetical protein Tcan_11860 [Toxocara canis]|uniref:N-acetyltransferase domain-containing protein n=1 Tax=Toxocara canis TaxID=6265 RepID=A0A0B2VY96_TOXCA|nr:hypothetical protein Tcan_11860 [Toxocara canis]